MGTGSSEEMTSLVLAKGLQNILKVFKSLPHNSLQGLGLPEYLKPLRILM